MDSERELGRIPVGRTAVLPWIHRNHEAFETAPARTDPEKCHAVNQIEDGLTGL